MNRVTVNLGRPLDATHRGDGVIPALVKLRDAGYRFVMVSNQDGRDTPSFPEEDFRPPQR